MSSDGSSREYGKVPDDAIIEFFRHSDRPFQTSSDVADEFGVERQSAHRRLQALFEGGRLEKETVGAHAVVWWLPEGTAETAAPAQPLTRLIGLVDEEAAETVRARSRQWRERFEAELASDFGNRRDDRSEDRRE